VQWAGKDRSIEYFEAGAFGYQVERNAFDALMITASEAAGAVVHRDVTVTEATYDSGGYWRISSRGKDGEVSERARWLLDCSGRAGVIARRDWRTSVSATRTIALVGVWERDDAWPVEDNTHTLVESYEDGWAWSVPVSSSTRYVTVMLDPSVTAIPTRSELAAAYLGELRRTRMVSELIDGASLAGAPWGCEASPYTTDRAYDDRLLLVGDAASFVDPLSSFGVKKALASAWLAAVVVNTALTDASLTSGALGLFARRERAMYEHLQQQSASLSRDAAGTYVSSYWADRSELQAVADESDLDVTKLRADPRVLGAFDELRRRPSIHLTAAESLAFVDRAVVRGNRVVMDRHLSSPSLLNPVRYCRGVDLVVITDLSANHHQVPDLFDAYNRVAPPAPLPDFLGALSTLIGFGVLSLA